MKICLGGFHFARCLMASVSFWKKMPTTDVQTDVCTFAACAYFHGDWLYHFFVMDKPEIQGLHINYKEVMAIVLSSNDGIICGRINMLSSGQITRQLSVL